jgi:hypothetical protein
VLGKMSGYPTSRTRARGARRWMPRSTAAIFGAAARTAAASRSVPPAVKCRRHGWPDGLVTLSSAHVARIELNPMSFPPIVIVTSESRGDRASNCGRFVPATVGCDRVMRAVVASEQATST